MCTPAQLKIRLTQIEQKAKVNNHSIRSKLYSFRKQYYKATDLSRQCVERYPDVFRVLFDGCKLFKDNIILYENQYIRIHHNVRKCTLLEFKNKRNNFIQQAIKLHEDIDFNIVSIVAFIQQMYDAYDVDKTIVNKK